MKVKLSDGMKAVITADDDDGASLGASIEDVHKIFTPLSAFGIDLCYTIHAIPLLCPLFHDPLTPLQCGHHIWMPSCIKITHHLVIREHRLGRG